MKWSNGGFWLLIAFLAAPLEGGDPAGDVPRFVDVTDEAGIDFVHINGSPERKDHIFEAKGGGVAFLDYDGDGFQDLYFVQGSTVEAARAGKSECGLLYRNQGDGTFRDVSAEAGIDCHAWGMGVAAGDYDNDGQVDLYLTHLGANTLYRNLGDGSFQDVTTEAGVAAPGWSTSAAFGDYDSDGDLDLYVAGYLDYDPDRLPPRTADCTYLGEPVLCGPRGLKGDRDYFFRNNGDGTFSDVTESSGAHDRLRSFGLGVLWSDLNNDRRPDLIVANDATPNLFFVNQGNGKFEEMGFLSGLAVSGDGNEQASMGVDSGDYDNDGLLDVFFTHFASDYSTLYHNDGDLLFRDVSSSARIAEPEWSLVSWGTRFVDLNHDGWKDLIHSNGHVYPYLVEPRNQERYAQPNSLYLNQRDGTFVDCSRMAGEDFLRPGVSRGVAFGDYDNDGDIDMVIANLNGRPLFLRNERRDENHWIMFRLVGRESNRDAIGARLLLKTGDMKQLGEVKRTVGIYSSSDPRVDFGIGPARRVDSLEVLWPSGRVDRFEAIEADRHYRIEEGGGIVPER